MLNKRFSSGFTRGILMPRSWNGELNLSIQGGRFHRGHLNGMGSAFRVGRPSCPSSDSPLWWCRNTLGGGMGLAAPTIYDRASDELKSKYLRQTLTGGLTWCQLFSDRAHAQILPALVHRKHDGDEWVINGQKVWNTMAHDADMAILVARTDWDVPKHAGITYS